jgi:cytochrome c-type biogenesis protein CcmE
VDLTPRTGDDASTAPKRKRKWAPMLIVALAIVGGGVVVTQFLTSAIDYYCNVDEVGVRSGCDAERRIRVQGVVEEGSVKSIDGETRFVISFHNKSLDVAYQGDPGGVFQECIPVVVHGRLNGDMFDGDRIEVKHSNQYVEANSDRIDESEKEADACSSLQG